MIPGGSYLFRGITGQEPYDNDSWKNASSIFGDDPFATTKGAWDWQRLGLGVLPATEALQAGMLESRGRYLGGPNNAGWSDRWNQWNATDVVGPDGRTLLSPMHQTGLRVGQDYGARDDQGNALSPIDNEIFGGFTFTQNQLAQNPYLDPTQQMGGYRAAMAGGPANADPAEYARQMLAAGGPGAVDAYGTRGVRDTRALAEGNRADQYGRRGAEQVGNLGNRFENNLYRDIDTEAQRTLATQLPEIQHAMEAAGLGRSGAGQLSMLQAQQDILGQANRDKQRTLASFAEANAGRTASSIDLASQLQAQGGMQEYGSIADMIARATEMGGGAESAFQGRQGSAIGQGLADRFAGNQVEREGTSSLWQQAMDREGQRYGMDSGNYLNALIASGEYGLGAMEQERLGQSAALQDWLALQEHREGTRRSSMMEYMDLADRERAIRQERVNQQIGASFIPYDSLMRIATGTTAPSSPQGGSTSPWGAVLADGASAFAEGAGGGIGEWFGDWMQKQL